MKALAFFMLVTAVGIAAVASAEVGKAAGVTSPAQAQKNYILKCQGCHGANATENALNTPPLAGMVSRFLTVEGGREFLVRVPGVSTAALNDAELAELLNWTLYRFDPGHMPKEFKPYEAAEVSRLRKSPLRTDAAVLRAKLIAQIAAQEK